VTSPVELLSYLQSALANQDTYAVVSQSASGYLSISAEIGPGPGDGSMAPLQGPTGDAGGAQFPLLLQLDVFPTPANLPTDLTNTNADIGKYWLIDQVDGNAVISSAAYIWFGAEFRVLPFGTQGPPGMYGIVAPYVSLLGPDETSQQLDVTGSGTANDPYLLTLELSVPHGPFGPSATLASFPDVDEGVPPTVGQFLAFTGDFTEDELAIWAPADVGDILPQPYIVPQAAFSSYAGIDFGSTVTIASFAVPPNPFPWKPLVWGQVEMFEVELSLSPLMIGVEVLLGDPNTGTLVARGFGNSLGGVVTIIPHTSSPTSPTTAMTPSNGVGLVEANHGGPAGTLYVNLVNDGLAALFDFNATGAQLFVMACPATEPTPTPIVGALSTKVSLSAGVRVGGVFSTQVALSGRVVAQGS
jgi:hypothetical protein